VIGNLQHHHTLLYQGTGVVFTPGREWTKRIAYALRMRFRTPGQPGAQRTPC
jgi:hypothetical protein